MQAETHTFLFADLAGFTALTEAHGDTDAADLAGEFFADVRSLLARHGAEEIKTIGDAVMIRCERADSAIALALAVVAEVSRRPGLPSVRVGINTGPAVEREGDWFGAAVNVAARISAAATGGQVLLSRATAEAAGAYGQERASLELPGHAEVRLVERGRRELRNVSEPVTLYEASCQGSRSAEGLAMDPVCRMSVDRAHAAGVLRHAGVEYHFCSLACAERFAAAPEVYAAAP